jgi:hypothetical protein
MHPNLAKALLPLVNQQDFNDLFQEYIDLKIEQTVREFEQSDVDSSMWKAQGKLHILRKIRDMKTEVRSTAERNWK